MFRLIESIPSKNAEPIKQWLAHLGSERIDEIFDPSIASQRSMDLYRAKGFDEKWIAERIKKMARLGGHAAKSPRNDLEKNLGELVITSENNLNYQYLDEKEKIENK